MWRSLVAHLTGGQGVAGSNPVIPTNSSLAITPALAPGRRWTTNHCAAITDFESFDADGLLNQVLVTVGYFWRF